MATLSQLPSVVDLAFVAGDTFRIRVRVVDPSTGDPVDDPPLNEDGDNLIGEAGEYGFCAQIAKSTDRHSIVGSFVITSDPGDPTNAIILTLSSTETEAILSTAAPASEFNGIWDLEVRFPNGDVRTVAKGTVHIVDDVSECAPVTP